MFSVTEDETWRQIVGAAYKLHTTLGPELLTLSENQNTLTQRRKAAKKETKSPLAFGGRNQDSGSCPSFPISYFRYYFFSMVLR